MKKTKNEKSPLKIVMLVGKYWSEDYNEIEAHIKLAEEYAIKLWGLGFGVFTPHLNTRHFEIKTKVPESIYQEFDRAVLKRLADCIFVLPNWKNSRGGKKEVKTALKQKIPVFFDFESICNWRDGKKPVHTIKKLMIKSSTKASKPRRFYLT